jgi:hypothetical protein
MARVYYGSTVRRIMGKIGNQIYSACGPYEYIKSYNHPPYDPNTTRQQLVRSTFDSLTDDWVVLDPAKRALWHKYATLTYSHGDGISLFLRHNLRLLLSKNNNLTQIDLPPANPSGIPQVSNFSIAAETDQNRITWSYSFPSESLYSQAFFRHHKPNLLSIHVYWALIDTVSVDDLELVHVHGFPAGTVLHYRLRLIDPQGKITPYTQQIKVTCQ